MLNSVSISKKINDLLFNSTWIITITFSFIYMISSVVYFKVDMTEDVYNVLRVISLNSASSLVFNDKKMATKVLDSIHLNKEIDAAVIFDAKGNIFSSYRKNKNIDLTPLIENVTLKEYRFSKSIDEMNDFHLTQTFFASPVLFNGNLFGYIQIKYSIESYYKYQIRALSFLLLVLPLMFFITRMYLKKIQSSITEPINDLVNFMDRIGKNINTEDSLQSFKIIELDKLQKGLKKLAVEVENRQAEDKKYNYKLEDLVNQRTADLKLVTEKAEDANKVKTRFLANMSHEIRTPMNGLIGLLRLLQHSKLDSKNAIYISRAVDASNQTMSILNDILDISKIEAKALNLEIIEIDLNHLFSSVISPMICVAEDKGINIFLEKIDVPEKIFSDKVRICQILNNLLSNALKFTEKGNICIKVQGPKNRKEETDEYWLDFRIDDTGIGMTKEQTLHVFNAFSQADDSMTRKFGGTGLGLNIASRLVEMLGGDLKVESKKGVGSSFFFSIKAHAPLGESKTSDKILMNIQHDIYTNTPIFPLYSFFGKSVLVAEDNKLNQVVIRDLLKMLHLSVDLASNGQEALSKFNKKVYHLILMDLQMPILNGIETTIQIRKEEKRRQAIKTPIICLTANATDLDIKTCLKAGVDDYLGKPYSPENLELKILKFLTPSDSTNDFKKDNYIDLDINSCVLNQSILEILKDESHLSLDALVCSWSNKLRLMREALKIEDRDLYSNIAHKLTGGCVLIESSSLPDFFKMMEDNSKDKDFEVLSKYVDEVEPCMEKIISDAKEYCLNYKFKKN